jgi:D-sedoheptulose 7-phosphate isomerase
VIKAVEYARANGIYTIGLLGGSGGRLGPLVDLALTVGVPLTARVQEAHILILHLLCEAFEPA